MERPASEDVPAASEQERPPAPAEPWSNRHPWTVAFISGAILFFAGYWFANFRESQAPKAIGESGTVGAFTHKLLAFSCTNEPPPTEPNTAPRQTCVGRFAIRNNSNSERSSEADVTLFVSDQRFDHVFGFSEHELFPNERKEVEIRFPIPAGASPTRLRIAAEVTFWDLFVPFYNDWLTYDVT